MEVNAACFAGGWRGARGESLITEHRTFLATIPPMDGRVPRPGARRSRSTSRELRILKTIAEALNGAGNVDEALQTTLERVAALLGLDAGWIWLTDPQTGRFYSAVAQRLPPFLREPVRMTGQSCWCLRAFREGELTAGNIDVMECSRLRAAVEARDRVRTRGLRYHASIPLYFGDRPLGIMNVAAPAWRRLTPRSSICCRRSPRRSASRSSGRGSPARACSSRGSRSAAGSRGRSTTRWRSGSPRSRC